MIDPAGRLAAALADRYRIERACDSRRCSAQHRYAIRFAKAPFATSVAARPEQEMSL